MNERGDMTRRPGENRAIEALVKHRTRGWSSYYVLLQGAYYGFAAPDGTRDDSHEERETCRGAGAAAASRVLKCSALPPQWPRGGDDESPGGARPLGC